MAAICQALCVRPRLSSLRPDCAQVTSATRASGCPAQCNLHLGFSPLPTVNWRDRHDSLLGENTEAPREAKSPVQSHTLWAKMKFHLILHLSLLSPTLPAPSEGALRSESEARKEGRVRGWDTSMRDLSPLGTPFSAPSWEADVFVSLDPRG